MLLLFNQALTDYYGNDRTLRHWLDSHQRQIKLILAELPADGWERLSAGAGSKDRAGMAGGAWS